MNLTLDPSHSVFGQASHVNNFFQDFAKSNDLCYFQFARLYADGSLLGLLNRVDLFQKIVDMGWVSFSSIREEDKTKCSYSFFWDEDLPNDPVEIARSHSSIYHAMTLVRRSRDHYDMIAFARNKPCSNPGGYYLTRLKALEDFALTFERAFKNVLKDPAPHLLRPPVHQQDPNRSLICLGNRNIPISGRDGETYLTPRELECLQLCARSLTIKQIGHQLGVSPRTVETLLLRSRDRTGLTLSEISSTLAMCP